MIFIWMACTLLLNGSLSIGNSIVRCLGDDGHIEIETECHPYCQETDADSNINHFKFLKKHTEHAEHNDCANCFDLTLKEPRQFICYSNRNLDQLIYNDLHLLFQNSQLYLLLDNFKSQKKNNILTFKQNPPSTSISITFLLC